MVVKHPTLPLTHPVVDVAVASSPFISFFAHWSPVFTGIAALVSSVWGGLLIYTWIRDNRK